MLVCLLIFFAGLVMLAQGITWGWNVAEMGLTLLVLLVFA
jgi:hypothetical protein